MAFMEQMIFGGALQFTPDVTPLSLNYFQIFVCLPSDSDLSVEA